jgi:hypothetical protein
MPINPDLVWHARKKVVYMQAPPDHSKRRIKGRYRGQDQGGGCCGAPSDVQDLSLSAPSAR